MAYPVDNGRHPSGRLRSEEWYGGGDRNRYTHRARMRPGVPSTASDGRPQIAIANTASDLTPCNSHLDEVAQAVEPGVYEAGGRQRRPPRRGDLGRTDAERNLPRLSEEVRADPVRGAVPPVGVVDDPQPRPRQHEGLVHGGPAVVFDFAEDLRARIDGPDLPVTANSVLLALVQEGDSIVLDVPRRLLQLDVPEQELARRTPTPALSDAFAASAWGWERWYVDHVHQAETGADLDVLVGASGPGVARDSR